MGRKTPPSKLYPKWTEAKVNQFIRTALRAAHSKWPPMREAQKEGRITLSKEEQEERGVRHKYEHQCARCEEWFKEADIQMDHIEQAGTSLQGWDQFIERLFVAKEGYQKLCKPCHKEKTKEDRKK